MNGDDDQERKRRENDAREQRIKEKEKQAQELLEKIHKEMNKKNQ